ncbi:glutamate transport system permease protein [Nocardioides luteus]|uniref:Glutamate ABC transporter permease n=1 Tax=Nocardioides luteus TaxID=1844 RepID=A0ABQ5T5U9_9ACTN|nr:amino acid ABC transporter permease [Nocardioides luteus]MDR7313667.1 glutamate transport system permease protein [Nocardioides luteus]GGR64152.1 glutamate ABC transporter permease [Nocardioides luteus]GLJ70486.1 glutamate ABC transporter permease [Nocardioides luteus]
MDLFSEYGSAILEAFGLTLRLAVFSGIFSLILGVVLAVFRVSPVPVLRWIGAAVVYTFRNTPLTLVMFFALFGLFYQLKIGASQTAPLNEQNFQLAVIALSVYTSTFVCEVLRSGINTVPLGQAEAARAIGLTFSQNLRLVVLPQALRSVLNPLASVMIAMIKNTTVAVTIGVVTAKGVNEASGQMRTMMENEADQIVLIFIIFAIGFMILTLPVGFLAGWASKKFAVIR